MCRKASPDQNYHWQNKKEMVSEEMMSISAKSSLLEYNRCSWGKNAVKFFSESSSPQTNTGVKVYTGSFV